MAYFIPTLLPPVNPRFVGNVRIVSCGSTFAILATEPSVEPLSTIIFFTVIPRASRRSSDDKHPIVSLYPFQLTIITDTVFMTVAKSFEASGEEDVKPDSEFLWQMPYSSSTSLLCPPVLTHRTWR